MAAGQILEWLGGQIDIVVEIADDWDATTWDDITEYVNGVRTASGTQSWDLRYGAASLELTLNNDTGAFTYNNGVDPFANYTWQLGLIVRVMAIPNPDEPDVGIPLFIGRVDRSQDVYAPSGGDIVTRVSALDALVDLAGYNPDALDTATGTETTSERVTTVLDNMSWPSELRNIQSGVHNMQTSFLAQPALEECQRAAEAEGGALWADNYANIVFKYRDWMFGGNLVMAPFATAVLADGPEAYWRFTGGAGVFNQDETANNHDLTFGSLIDLEQDGVTSDDEAIGPDGEGATVASEGALEILDDMTIEAWIRPDTSATGLDAIITCRGSGADAPLYELYVDADNECLTFFPSTSAGANKSTANGSVPLGSWTHVAVTIDWNSSVSRFVRIYINGVIKTFDLFEFAPQALTRAVRVAQRATDNDLGFQGELSELVVYDKVLSSAAILGHYRSLESQFSPRSVNIQGMLGYESGEGLPLVEDDFTGTTIDTAIWENFTEPNTSQDGTLAVGNGAGSSDTFNTVDIFHSSQIRYSLELVARPDATSGGYAYMEFGFGAGRDGLYIEDNGGSSQNVYFYDYAESAYTPFEAYDHASHPWLRFTLDSGTFTYEGSADGETWEELYSGQYDGFIEDLSLNFDCSPTTDGDIEIDNVSIEYVAPHKADIVDAKTSWDMARVRNEIGFSRTGGSIQEVSDATSIAQHGQRSYKRLDFNNTTNAEVLTLANRYLDAYKDSRPRIESVTIVANNDPDNEDLNRLFWDSRFGDLLAVKVRTLHGWEIETQAHVIGISHNITADDWEVTFILDDSLAVLEES